MPLRRKASPVPQNQPRLPVAIVGLGISGKSALELLLAQGLDRADIVTFDQKSPCDVNDPGELTRRKPARLVVSPGVPLRTPWIQDLLRAGAELTSELELAYGELTTEKVVGITGSVGKSTVTSLLGAGLNGARIPNFTGGNLGLPLAQYATQRLGGRAAVDYVVLELSSYQLENFPSLDCESSIITSLTPNHMERYDSLDSYYETKLRLAEQTRGNRIFNGSGLDLTKYRDRFGDSQDIWTDRRDPAIPPDAFQKMKMVGTHNRDNLALAWRWGVAHAMPQAFFDGLLAFPGLPHRLENLGEHRGVLFLNDSKATTMASVLQAVDSIRELAATRARTYLLLGGRDKNLPWHELRALSGQTMNFAFFGECAELARRESGLTGPVDSTLALTLDRLLPILNPGDMVLLSPGGTSLDEFKSFEQRGDYFRKRIATP